MRERKKVGRVSRGREKEKKREGKESLFTKIYYLVWDTYTLQIKTERQEETMDLRYKGSTIPHLNH